MPTFKSYPTVKDTPSRKQRKSRRRSTFEYNSLQAAVERRARREARKAEVK